MFTKPSTLLFNRSKNNTNGAALDETQLRYIVTIDGTDGAELVATDSGASQATVSLSELPDVAGTHTVSLKCKNLVNSLVSVASANITVTVVDENTFPPEAPSALSAS